MDPCRLWLANKKSFPGLAPEKQPCVSGEVVFTTGMTGYVESLTDPSYAGQILVFTYPLIGNYGTPPPCDWESKKIQVAGVVMGELCHHGNHHRNQQQLLAWLNEQQIPWIEGVDTRAITKKLRSQGSILGAIARTLPEQLRDPNQEHLISTVSVTEPRTYRTPEAQYTVAVLDCGIKEGIIQCLQKQSLTLIRIPYHYDLDALAWDALVLSNGPGNPEQCPEAITNVQKALRKEKPIFGICLGTQILALAAGAKTYKLPFGHRGQNQPVQELATGTCFITSQNHGYAVDSASLSTDWEVTFTNLNDGSVEGIAHRSLPFQAVQFHPEAKPGPLDTQWLFERFKRFL